MSTRQAAQIIGFKITRSILDSIIFHKRYTPHFSNILNNYSKKHFDPRRIELQIIIFCQSFQSVMRENKCSRSLCLPLSVPFLGVISKVLGVELPLNNTQFSISADSRSPSVTVEETTVWNRDIGAKGIGIFAVNPIIADQQRFLRHSQGDP